VIDFAAGLQSGGRPPAEGRLGLVQAFVNSHFDLDPARRGADVWATPAGLGAWLSARGLDPAGHRPGRAEHARALAVREGLRAVLAGHHGEPPDRARVEALRAAARGLVSGTEVDDRGATVPVPASAGVAGALGLVLALVHEADAAGTWRRLKACPGDHCGWAFYDRSRNGGSTWCSMQVCGGREKARAYRARGLSGKSGPTGVVQDQAGR